MSAKVKEKPPGSGKWFVFVNHKGTRRSALAPSKRDAETTAKIINQKILSGSFTLESSSEIKSFREYADIYLQHCTIKPSTKADYISILKCHIFPEFGARAVDKITRLDIKNFLKKKLAGGLTISTVEHFRACLCNIFDTAYDDEVIPQNPAARLGRIAGRSQIAHTSGVKPRFLSKDELSTLLETFLKYKPEHYPLAMLLSRTGMRVGEAVALQWSDIDFEKIVIHVKRSKARTIIDTPKSGKSRDVDMSRQLADVMRRLRMEMISGSVKTGKRSKWVFPGKSAETIDATAWRKRTFNSMVRRAGLEKMRVHDLRHTYASLMLAAGQPLIYVQRQLGHHSIQITADTYSHLIPREDQGAVDALDDIPKKDIPVWKEM
jgi:integrase